MFRGNHITSKLIAFIEQLPFSHIGLLWTVEDEQIQMLPANGEVHVAESDDTKRDDLVLGTKHAGVQVSRDGVERVAQYEGEVWWKPLIKCENREQCANKLKWTLSKMCGQPYNADPWSWLVSGTRNFRTDEITTEQGFHCLAFTGYALRKMGIFHKRFSPLNLQIVDFFEPDRLNTLTDGANRYRYDRLVHLIKTTD